MPSWSGDPLVIRTKLPGHFRFCTESLQTMQKHNPQRKKTLGKTLNGETINTFDY